MNDRDRYIHLPNARTEAIEFDLDLATAAKVERLAREHGVTSDDAVHTLLAYGVQHIRERTADG